MWDKKSLSCLRHPVWKYFCYGSSSKWIKNTVLVTMLPIMFVIHCGKIRNVFEQKLSIDFYPNYLWIVCQKLKKLKSTWNLVVCDWLPKFYMDAEWMSDSNFWTSLGGPLVKKSTLPRQLTQTWSLVLETKIPHTKFASGQRTLKNQSLKKLEILGGNYWGERRRSINKPLLRNGLWGLRRTE